MLNASNKGISFTEDEIIPPGRWGLGKAVARDAMIYYPVSNGGVCQLNTHDGFHLSIHLNNSTNGSWLRDAIVGANSKIYWPPGRANHILTLNMKWKELSLMKFHEDAIQNKALKYYGGVLAASGHIYCVPSDADQVLEIDTRPSNMTRKGAVRGINDSPKLSPDWLGYNLYVRDKVITKYKWNKMVKNVD